MRDKSVTRYLIHMTQNIVAEMVTTHQNDSPPYNMKVFKGRLDLKF
jgi:hypothetical protein